jgi:hypothetical protein
MPSRHFVKTSRSAIAWRAFNETECARLCISIRIALANRERARKDFALHPAGGHAFLHDPVIDLFEKPGTAVMIVGCTSRRYSPTTSNDGA